MRDDRRAFLKTVGGVSAAVAAAPSEAQDGREVGHDVSAAAVRPGATSRFALEVDGASVGVLNDYAGGTVGAEVVEDPPGEDGVVRKHLGRLQYEDLSLHARTDLLKPPFFNWVADTLGRNFTRHDGSVRGFDFNFKQTRETDFKDALLTEVGFPSFEAGAKDAALFRFAIKPGQLEVKGGSDAKVTVPPGKGTAALRSNFRLTIDGLSKATPKVSKIEAFSVRMRVLFFGDEGCAPLGFEAGPLAVDDLVIRCAEPAAKELYDWHQDFVIKGACGGEAKGARNGTLELLAPNLKTVLLTIQLNGLGIHDLGLEAGAGDSVAQVVARMYCEQVTLKGGAV